MYTRLGDEQMTRKRQLTNCIPELVMRKWHEDTSQTVYQTW
jgi:hypothetical protein